jgi:galactokinase
MNLATAPAIQVQQCFRDLFGSEPGVAVTPGRVNLVGEHTDYNDGFVLPMGIDLHVAVAFAPRSDRVLRAHSLNRGETRERDVSGLTAPGGSKWFDYVTSVAWALGAAGERVRGADLAIAGDVPIGAGLSSSAALEVGVARALCAVSGIEWDPTRMAQLCQRAENEFVGVSCGIMDQYTAANASAGHALLLDCRSLTHSKTPVPAAGCFVVLDTGVRRKLASGEYNRRRASCEGALAVVAARDPQVKALRDVTPEQLTAVERLMDDETFRRARHVVDEIPRPRQLAAALQRGDLTAAGRVMNESHYSLRDLYQVSSHELDEITRLARSAEGCYGARMTGAGFGGCAIALVAVDKTGAFVSKMMQAYQPPGNKAAYFHVCNASDGAKLI